VKCHNFYPLIAANSIGQACVEWRKEGTKDSLQISFLMKFKKLGLELVLKIEELYLKITREYVQLHGGSAHNKLLGKSNYK
jgi:hypothetical protein